MEKLTGIFKLIEEKKYDSTHCFLCGCLLENSNKTVEHIIPKWLQRKLNLWDLKLRLLNRTTIHYRNLTIPCCHTCNNEFLGPFERQIQEACDKGFNDVIKLDRKILFLWLSKIYYGLLYKQSFLPFDRKDVTRGNIMDDKALDSFYNHLLFLQGLRGKHEFDNFFPASIYVFETQQSDIKEDNWDFIDNYTIPFVALRINDMGIIALLQDCQTSQYLEGALEKYHKYKLHPLQFRELATQILYKGLLLKRPPLFMNVQSKGVVKTKLMSIGDTVKLFDDWNYNDYADLLSMILGYPYEDIRPNEKTIRSYLTGKDGQPIFLDINKVLY